VRRLTRGPACAAVAGVLFAIGTAAAAQERVRFPSLDGDLSHASPTEIDGYLYRPPGEGPFPAVVALHGCSGLFARNATRLSARHREWGRLLVEQGYVVLFPDSFNPRGTAEVCTRAHAPIPPRTQRVSDAYGALAYLRAQPFVASHRIAVLGWSHGGSTALWAASRAAEALLAASAGGRFRVGIVFYPGCDDPARRGWRAAIPVHILAAEADDWTPPEACRLLAERSVAAGDQVEFVAYPGALHGFDAPNQPRTVRQGVRTPTGTATVGTDPAARADALRRVPGILAQALKEGP